MLVVNLSFDLQPLYQCLSYQSINFQFCFGPIGKFCLADFLHQWILCQACYKVISRPDSIINIVYHLQLKEWGFLCRDVFGPRLGSGDYGHLLIEHAEQLLRKFRSLREYSNQGFEALHKLQRILYSRATNHDQSGPGSSSKYWL